jgi:hypothetical protein
MRIARCWVFIALLAIGFYTQPWLRLQAQVVTGTILGSITDASGARISGAGVTVTNDLTGEKHTATTTPTGDYVVTALPVGNYRVEVEAQGFKKYLRKGIVLEVNQNARIDAQLELGTVSQCRAKAHRAGVARGNPAGWRYPHLPESGESVALRCGLERQTAERSRSGAYVPVGSCCSTCFPITLK